MDFSSRLSATTLKYLRKFGVSVDPPKRINDETVVLATGVRDPNGDESFQDDKMEGVEESGSENDGVFVANEGSYLEGGGNLFENLEYSVGNELNFDGDASNFHQDSTNMQEEDINFELGTIDYQQDSRNFQEDAIDFQEGTSNFQEENTEYQPGAIDYEQGTTNYQQDTIDFQPGTTNYQQDTIDFHQGTTNYQQGTINYQPGTTNYQQGAIDYQENIDSTDNDQSNFQDISHISNLPPQSNFLLDPNFTDNDFIQPSIAPSCTQDLFKGPPEKRKRLEDSNLPPSEPFSQLFDPENILFQRNVDDNSETTLHNGTSDIMNMATHMSGDLMDQESELELTIDETMVPERVRNFQLEKSIIHKEKVKISTLYTSRLTRCSNKIIEEYAKFQQPKDWNAVAQDMLKAFEPSMDYLYLKFKTQREVQLGDADQEIGDEIQMEDIRESLAEIEKSFDASEASFVASTPTKANKSYGSAGKSLEIREKVKTSMETGENFKDISQKMSQRSLKPLENSSQNSKSSSQKVPKIPQKSPVKSQPMRRSSQRLSDQQNHMKSVSDIFVDIDVTQKSVNESRFLPYLSICNARDDSDDEEDFRGFSNEEQREGNETLSNLIEVLRQDPVEALQAMTQENPILFDARCTAILSQIEKIYVSMLESLVNQKPLVLKIRTVRNWNDCVMSNEILSQNEVNVTKRISFGNKNTQKSFAVMVVVMCEIYRLLSRGSTCTKRELYYRDVELFGSQETVNRAVNNLCAMLNVQEFELGLTSSSKGLVAGDLIINIGEESINCANPRAVPQNPSEITSFETAAKFVLVVEKDTVFQRFITDEIFTKISSNIILITGKGYPDINTRMLLKKLSTETNLPIYIIVDADPHGVEIMCTYKYGSMMMVHNSTHLAVPGIHWIGIHPSDIEGLDVTKVDMTDAELKKVDEILERPYIDEKLRRELNIFKDMKLKAEIESLYHFSTDFLINDFIPRKIRLTEMPAMPNIFLH